MRVRWLSVLTLVLAGVFVSGCGLFNRDPNNVFYGTREYTRRASTLALTEDIAFRQALEKATRDEQQRGEERRQFVGRHPTLIHGRLYVFSIETPEGASLRGYHVDGDSGLVQFYMNDEFIKRPKK